jgi:hypothetical protein
MRLSWVLPQCNVDFLVGLWECFLDASISYKWVEVCVVLVAVFKGMLSWIFH